MSNLTEILQRLMDRVRQMEWENVEGEPTRVGHVRAMLDHGQDSSVSGESVRARILRMEGRPPYGTGVAEDFMERQRQRFMDGTIREADSPPVQGSGEFPGLEQWMSTGRIDACGQPCPPIPLRGSVQIIFDFYGRGVLPGDSLGRDIHRWMGQFQGSGFLPVDTHQLAARVRERMDGRARADVYVRRVIVAGNHNQYSSCLRERGWSTRLNSYMGRANSLLGLPDEVEVVLYGTYYERSDWPEIEDWLRDRGRGGLTDSYSKEDFHLDLIRWMDTEGRREFDDWESIYDRTQRRWDKNTHYPGRTFRVWVWTEVFVQANPDLAKLGGASGPGLVVYCMNQVGTDDIGVGQELAKAYRGMMEECVVRASPQWDLPGLRGFWPTSGDSHSRIVWEYERARRRRGSRSSSEVWGPSPAREFVWDVRPGERQWRPEASPGICRRDADGTTEVYIEGDWLRLIGAPISLEGLRWIDPRCVSEFSGIYRRWVTEAIRGPFPQYVMGYAPTISRWESTIIGGFDYVPESRREPTTSYRAWWERLRFGRPGGRSD